MTPKQIMGYRAQLMGAINQSRDGATVTLDLTSANQIKACLDRLISVERNAADGSQQ